MPKFLKVAKHEYLHRVRQRSFLYAVLGIPLLMVVVSGVSILMTLRGGDDRPMGYVDQADLVDANVVSAIQSEQPEVGEFIAYASEDLARAALGEGTIQAFYVVPEDYLTTKQLSLFYGERAPGEFAQDGFEDIIRASLVQQQTTEVQRLLDDGLNFAVRSSDGRREFSEGNIVNVIFPFIAVFFLFFAVVSAGGYMLQAVTDEKENRTVEILATSLSPEQLIAGKALGLMGVSLTQLGVWIIALVVGLGVAARFVDFLSGLQVPWALLGLTALYFLPTFALIAGVMTVLGASVTELQQGQQISGIINMLFILPVFFAALIFVNPNSPYLVALTLFPTTAFVTILLRTSAAAVPLWQMILSWILVTGSAAGAVWLAARVFRIGMLQYGQRLSLKHIVAGLQDRRVVTLEEEMNTYA